MAAREIRDQDCGRQVSAEPSGESGLAPRRHNAELLRTELERAPHQLMDVREI